MTNTKDVIIYSTPTCGYCKKAKAYFSENDIEYTEHDVSSDQDAAQEMVKKSGQKGVPVIVIDDEIVVGFDKKRLSDLLNL
jgi:glutaredoxin-like YruB-family protein